ncbi:hypothetical protein HQ590_13050 [bacterium]|nr:hypothetical protein [bacterium]
MKRWWLIFGVVALLLAAMEGWLWWWALQPFEGKEGPSLAEVLKRARSRRATTVDADLLSVNPDRERAGLVRLQADWKAVEGTPSGGNGSSSSIRHSGQ